MEVYPSYIKIAGTSAWMDHHLFQSQADQLAGQVPGDGEKGLRGQLCLSFSETEMEMEIMWVCLKIGYIPNEIAI